MTQTPQQLRRDIAMTIVGLSDRGEISLTAIEHILNEYDSLKQKEQKESIPAKYRMLEVCQKYGITSASISSNKRGKQLRAARIELALALRAGGLTNSDIGRIMNRDHTTICKLCRAAPP